MATEKATPEVQHISLPAQDRFEGLIERVLTSTAQNPGVVEIVVPPTGSTYLNALTRGQLEIRLSDGVQTEIPDLYLGGQLLREMPQARITTPLSLAGLQFTATGFYRLFQLDASRLTDRVTPLEAIDGQLAAALREALAAVRTGEEAADIMQDTLATKLPSALPPDLATEAAGQIERKAGRIGMTELAEACDVSPRHLRRVFSREVGVSPKSYAKAIQINTVVAALQSGETGAVHDLALAHGYYDQAHFTRDFSRLVGSNPSKFLASREAFLEMFLGRNSNR